MAVLVCWLQDTFYLINASFTERKAALMVDLLASYNALSPSSPRTEVAKVLNALISGAPLNRLVFG